MPVQERSKSTMKVGVQANPPAPVLPCWSASESFTGVTTVSSALALDLVDKGNHLLAVDTSDAKDILRP